MADLSLRAEFAPVTLPPVLAYIMGVDIAPRASVERLIQAAFDALDAMDGDPDLENATDAEDDFSLSPDVAEWASGVLGCPISDPGGDEHDGREECEELTPDYGIDQTKSLPDAMVITSDRNAMRVHRDRIRNEACDKFTRYGVTDYRLR